MGRHHPYPGSRRTNFRGRTAGSDTRASLTAGVPGTGLQLDYKEKSGEFLTGQEIITLKRAGDPLANEVYRRLCQPTGTGRSRCRQICSTPMFLSLAAACRILRNSMTICRRKSHLSIFSDTFETPVQKGASWRQFRCQRSRLAVGETTKTAEAAPDCPALPAARPRARDPQAARNIPDFSPSAVRA